MCLVSFNLPKKELNKTFIKIIYHIYCLLVKYTLEKDKTMYFFGIIGWLKQYEYF